MSLTQNFLQSRNPDGYSRLLITRTFKGNRKNLKLAGVRVIRSMKQITGEEEIGWGMNASNKHTSKLNSAGHCILTGLTKK